MLRLLLSASLLVAASSASAFAAGPQGIDAVMRHYAPSDVEAGKIEVSASGDVAYVSGTSEQGPWLDVWRRADGCWRKVAAVVRTELAPLRFGAKRDRGCRRIS